MKPKYILISSLIMLILLGLPGCAVARPIEFPETSASISATTSPATTVTVPEITSGTAAGTTNESTALPTPEPTPEPTLKPTPEPTPKPTIKPTPKPTAIPTPSADKVVLAEGFYYMKLDDALKSRITGYSYPADDSDARISYVDLRYIKLLHYDFDGNVLEGELIVHAKLAAEVMEIFYELYQAKYPLTSVRLVDDYGETANDDLSMAANNTSAFNYRFVSGTTTLSRHAYGAAIDINPRLNPYINGDEISPENGAAYADRTLDFAGKIDHNDLCYKLFIAHGWSWGGDWDGDKDYQHFSKKISY